MDGKHAFTTDEQPAAGRAGEPPRAVIVEVSAGGAARINQAPPDVLMMFVESKEISPEQKHTLAVGAGGQTLAPGMNSTSRPRPRQIPVSVPG